jgi:uncharacterized protein YndB with AHSA1/START domain
MPELLHSIEISATPRVIYPLVSTADGLAKWWAEDTTSRDTGVELSFFGGASVYRLRSLTFVPPAAASWLCETGKEWAATRIVFHLAARGDKTEVRFIHEGWREATPYFVSCNSAWGALLYRLKAVAEGSAIGPLFTKEGLRNG